LVALVTLTQMIFCTPFAMHVRYHPAPHLKVHRQFSHICCSCSSAYTGACCRHPRP
jgi:hypothetical protein